MKAALINLSLFKIAWFACVLLAASGRPLWASLAACVAILVHLGRVAVPVKEALYLSAAALIGLAWESFMLSTGLVIYPEGSAAGGWPPHWIIAMWALFATTIGHGLEWMKRHWALCSAFGLIGGPLAFLAGSAMGAVAFPDTIAALATIALGWALLLPLLALLSDTLIDSAFLEPADERVVTPSQARGYAVSRGQEI